MKQKITSRSIAENTDEFGIINWDNIEIPRLNVGSRKVEVKYVPPMADDRCGDVAEGLTKPANLERTDKSYYEHEKRNNMPMLGPPAWQSCPDFLLG